MNRPTPTVATDEVEMLLGDDEGLRELGLLYNCAIGDDSRQFTRWQMIVAMNHGMRLARAAISSTRMDELREACRDLYEALAAIQALADGDDGIPPHVLVELNRKAHAALAKARALLGEQRHGN